MSDTPRTDAVHKAQGGVPYFEMWKHAEALERELARALRVVNAAKAYADYGDSYSSMKLKEAFWEWEAGR